MYLDQYAIKNPDRAAIIMASSGKTISYSEFEGRANQLAHALRSEGLQRLDHYSIFMENNEWYMESNAAGERTGSYYTCVNSFLTAEELTYILSNSRSEVLVTSTSKAHTALEALDGAPNVRKVFVCGGVPSDISDPRVVDYTKATSSMPTTPIEDESLGTPMLYSSGTTGRPKGILRPLPDQPPAEMLPLHTFLLNLWQYREEMIYLSPAPLYHSAPQAAVSLTMRAGGTVIVMEKFDPVEYLRLIETYSVSHSQLVPTMFSRMLKLSDEQRLQFDLSSLEFAVHAAAPCPVKVKHQMIEWWGPIIHEYYGATEGLGFAACDSEQWLSHPGTVGKIVLGEVHVMDDEMNELPNGTPGTLWFGSGTEFTYLDDPEKTKESTSPDGTMTTVGDIGYVDDDGFLYLTDRKTFMIISGGVNIYPQEIEDLLITHPKVFDAAVFGVPNEDLGEEVKAVIQVMPDITAGDELTEELLQHCRDQLSRQKVPRSIDYEAELPRLPTGKLYKRLLRDRYWGGGTNKIV